jgi:hypothetical protein
LSESEKRGYKFDGSKIPPTDFVEPIIETEGQLDYEWQHLLRKLQVRDPELYGQYIQRTPTPHPLFTLVPGEIREWENVA